MIKRCDKGNLHSFEDVPIKTEESEVESEIDTSTNRGMAITTVGEGG